MTVAMIVNLRGMTNTQHATARGRVGVALQPANPVHVGGPTVDGWRVVEVWEPSEVTGAFFQAVPLLIADAADGDPTWEDAAWQ